MRFQRTIKNTMAVEGIGLHSGRPVRMLLQPAAAGQGIVFIRTDLGGVEIAAAAENTSATSYATTLSRNNASIKTVEHLLAALAGLGIDNVTIEIDGEELPILDGSAAPFVRLIVEAGIQMQSLQRSTIKITKPIFVREGSKQVALWPADSPSISYFIDFDHPLLREQAMNIPVSEESFLRELADARTFGFLSDVQMLQANGLARGGSLENAVVLDEQKVLNKEGLRHRDEFVRHKILDLIGDLSLAGMPIIGHVVAHKAGHSLNARMVKKLLEHPECWTVIGSPAATRELPQEAHYQYQASL
ncbi:MAG: UDP-3-O-[3-hydroxymyristoyl] N-acetylglucosamine deacetylase [Nitrospirae bacterium GWC2_57_13]|nr:MAG: UDP-3-O-[3-hydroxymyristoyl] N-acetylglucosamine deacetylase [Nitrospirae bacterium GWC2_57_13]OGW46840.1 MAG: UDP-3-O-[3-hydroxymyristoyl] N-acetylglucosamine deacetylase [Nitrospirae bacterium GWD2_57_8]